MCAFEMELETVIEGLVDEDKSFTSKDVRDGIRSEHNMPIRYKEANYATLTHMQHFGADYGYVARSIKVITGQDVLGQDEFAQVWEFVPTKTIVEEFDGDAEDVETEVVVTPKANGGFFARIFNRSANDNDD